MVGLNVWVLSFYGSYGKERTLDILGAVILLAYVCEIALKIFAYDFDEFWYYARYHGPKHSVEEEYHMSKKSLSEEESRSPRAEKAHSFASHNTFHERGGSDMEAITHEVRDAVGDCVCVYVCVVSRFHNSSYKLIMFLS